MQHQQPHTVFVIVGPTAVGKTSLSVRLAKHFQTQIISADSRQCFSELNIGVAKPSAVQLSAVQHYFINSHSVTQTVNAATFSDYALKSAKEIFHHANTAILVGGTGLYVKAFCEGFDEIPAVPDAVRAQILSAYQQQGIHFLQKELAEKDPVYWQQAEQQNPQRLMRALEVLYATGNSILTYQNNKKEIRPFNIVKIGLELPRDILYQRINSRVDEMIEQGLQEEVKQLIPYKQSNALQTVGYKELFDFFDGKTSLQQATDLIKQNTRHYAKRQMTWFKKDKEIIWFSPEDEANIIRYLQQSL